MASIRERTRKDGTPSWAVLWREASTGKQTSRTYLEQREAQALKDFLDANGNSFALAVQAAKRLRSTAPTVRVVVERHIERLTGVEYWTREKYSRNAARHIYPALGSIPVDTLTRDDVAAWFNSLQMADKTKRNIQALLSSALHGAAEAGLTESNVARGIRPPRSTTRTREPVFLTREEIRTIEDQTHETFQLFIRLLADTGLRYSEATALTVEDISLDDNGRASVRVTKAWKKGELGGVVRGPKSTAGRRTITVPAATGERLAAHVQEKDLRDLLFPHDGTGGELTHGYYYKRYWVPAIAGLRRRPAPHDLRHSHASALIAAGIPLPVIQRRLGHSSIKMTADTYGHLLTDADQLAADALDG